MKKTLLTKLFFAGTLLLTLLSGCGQAQDQDPIMHKDPVYLLSGSKAGTDGLYDYYLLENGTYAVSLTDAEKSSRTYGDTLDLPDTYNGKAVTGIWRQGFQGAAMKHVVLHNGITVIDYEAFLFATALENVTIPCTVEAIGEGAFYACSGLRSATFNNSTEPSSSEAALNTCVVGASEEEVSYSNLTILPAFCFYKCYAMTTVSLPAKLEEIRYEAFNGCYALDGMLSFSSLKIIRARAFQGCSGIDQIFLPSVMFTSQDGCIEPLAFNNAPNIHFFLAAGDQATYDSWVAGSANWAWYNESANPSGNSYTVNADDSKPGYEITSGDTFRTADWAYTVTGNDVTITAYLGAVPASGNFFLSIPDALPVGSAQKVREIDISVLSGFKKRITRLYLPQYLRKLQDYFFDGFDVLTVVDDSHNGMCQGDQQAEEAHTAIRSRIDLHAMKDLTYIGEYCFAHLKLLNGFTKLHLPSGLEIVGHHAFSTQGGNSHLVNVTEFVWDYEASNAKLRHIGNGAFFKIGHPYKDGNSFTDGQKYHYHRTYGDGSENFKYTTLVFPATMENFGCSSALTAEYGLSTHNTQAAHFFTGSPLIRTVIFKGSDDSTKTSDLYMGIQLFAYNVSLQTVIFEERNGHVIHFGTESGKWAEPTIGTQCGRYGNDFRADSTLQTIVLPTETTVLEMQSASLMSNARCALYLTGTLDGGNVLGNTANDTVDKWYTSHSTTALSNVTQWKAFGVEDYYPGKGYFGYCFAPAQNSQYNSFKNSFNLKQEMPVYENVYYHGTYSLEGGDASIEVTCGNKDEGDSTLVIQGDYACVCKDGEATMANYLYDRTKGITGGIARVPATVTDEGGNTYTMTAIGESAFTSCYCDDTATYFTPSGNSWTGHTADEIYGADHPDLTYVELPDTIESIGDYAFVRAYGIQQIRSYNVSTGVSNGDYVMPSSLAHVGKLAFAFTRIEAFLSFPDDCVFYENESTTTSNYEPSCFSNNLSLRRITFAGTSSYYMTTTYTSESGDTYVSGLYSKSGAPSHASRLLILLNRDQDDYDKVAGDTTAAIRYNIPSGYGKPFLYGAFRMGRWLKTLTIGAGTCVSGDSGSMIEQAYFSCICERSVDDGVVTLNDVDIYLGRVLPLFDDQETDLTAVSGNTTNMVPSGIAGCDNLRYIDLAANPGGTIGESAFPNMSADSQLIFQTPGQTPGTYIAQQGLLDLTYTGYTSISKRAFEKNLALTRFVAPAVDEFVLKEYVFQSCTNLKTLDFSKVKKKLNLWTDTCKLCGVDTIIWPEDAGCVVTIGGGVFAQCKSLDSVDIPANCKMSGGWIFEKCTALTHFGVAGNATNSSTTEFGQQSFIGCNALVDFEFEAFTNSQMTISPECFKDCTSTIDNGGEIVLPSNYVRVAKCGFINATGITGVTIECDSRFTINESAFSTCTSLTHVTFTDPDCTYGNYEKKIFEKCTALVEVVLPSGFNLANTLSSGNSQYLSCTGGVAIYTYAKSADVSSVTTDWRVTANGLSAPLYYYCQTALDALDGSLAALDDSFWTLDGSGNVVALGTVTDVTTVDGVTTVHFSSGHTLDSNGTLV